MALLKATSAARWFVIGKDHGKPVRWQIQPVPAAVDREIRREVFGDVKSRKAGNQPMSREYERYEEFAARRAAYALKDVENFGIELGDEGAVAIYGPLLQVEAKPGQEVFLDGKCTDDVKRRLFADFPRYAGKASDLADSITQSEIDEEEAATEAF